MLKILHIADVHLDTIFASRSARVRQRLRDSIRRAFVSAVDLALQERVDAVVIAGDLFDGDNLSFTTEKLIIEEFARLTEAGIGVFYATGNHDPASIRARAVGLPWPEGFHMFRSREPEAVELRGRSGELKAIIVGAGHESAREQDNLAMGFPHAKGEVPHVGVLHTIVTSAASSQLHDRYAPCEVEDLRRTGYDYWALGHVHTRQQVDPESNAWYPGNLVGRTPRESGARGVLLAHVERGKPAVTRFVPLAPVEWVSVTLDDLGEAVSVSDLEALAQDRFEAVRRASEARDWVVVLDLAGPCPLEPELRNPDQIEELESILATSLSVLAVEVRSSRLRAPVDVESFSGKPHLLGETLSVIREMQKDDELLQRLAPDPLAPRLKTESAQVEYLRSLLDGLENEAVRRLVTDEGLR